MIRETSQWTNDSLLSPSVEARRLMMSPFPFLSTSMTG